MQFGIDFGTTRTVIAACDRGNYPVVSVEDPHGDSHDFLPSVVALDGERIVCGWEAMELRGTPTFTRSFKRALSGPYVTAATPVALGTQTRTVGEILAAYATHVVGHLQRFQKELTDSSPIEVVLGVPAHSHHAQRLITMSAFSRTGITVKGLINEPSAAAFEYTHRHSRTLNSRRTSILVYDLGGGTFDASLVSITGGNHTIVDTVGRPRLGGDDLDKVLATLALDTLGRADDAFSATARMRLLDEAKSAKEAIVPQSRRIVLAVGDEDVTIPVPVFYEAASPLIDETLAAIAPLIGSDSLRDTSIAGIYLVGGTTSLPVVAQTLRKKFGHRVHRSPLPSPPSPSSPKRSARSSATASTALPCPPPRQPSASPSPPIRIPTSPSARSAPTPSVSSVNGMPAARSASTRSSAPAPTSPLLNASTGPHTMSAGSATGNSTTTSPSSPRWLSPLPPTPSPFPRTNSVASQSPAPTAAPSCTNVSPSTTTALSPSPSMSTNSAFTSVASFFSWLLALGSWRGPHSLWISLECGPSSCSHSGFCIPWAANELPGNTMRPNSTPAPRLQSQPGRTLD